MSPDASSDEDLFFSDQHPASRRYAVFEDDGKSAWLYLTEPDDTMPVADAWVYNRVPAPSPEEVESYRSQPPPAAAGYAGDRALCESPDDHQWSFLWSPDGESVAIAKDGQPAACIISGHNRGYSKELIKDGPWGNRWSEELFQETFSPK